jgi:hypothetical protein
MTRDTRAEFGLERALAPPCPHFAGTPLRMHLDCGWIVGKALGRGFFLSFSDRPFAMGAIHNNDEERAYEHQK